MGFSDLWLSAASCSLPPLERRCGGKKSKIYSACAHTHTHTHFFSHTLLTIPPHAAVCIKSAFTIRCSKEVWWSVTSGSNLSWLRQLKCLSDYSLTVYILTMRCVCLFVTSIHPGKSVFLESVHYLSILDHTVWLLLELESAMGDFFKAACRFELSSGFNL